MPADPVVMRWLEAAVVDGLAYRLVEVADQSAVPGQAGEDREVAFRHAEGQVDLPGITPLGDDPTAAQDEAVGAAARAYRPQRRVPWRLLAEIARYHKGEVAAPRRLVLAGMP